MTTDKRLIEVDFPLEAMRLGCEVTAVDINPVAWFILEKSRAEGQSEECAILEKLSNHLRKIGAAANLSLTLAG